MISNPLRERAEKIFIALARPLHRLGVSPNLLTRVGLLITLCAAGLLAFGYQRIAGVVIIPASLLDALDGALARLGGKDTPYGAFLDSTLDRWAEIALYLGLLYWYIQRGAKLEIALIYLTIAGSSWSPTPGPEPRGWASNARWGSSPAPSASSPSSLGSSCN